MAEIERLNEELRFPLPQGEKIDWPYMREIIGILEEQLGRQTNTTVNLLLDQAGNTLIYYFGVPNSNAVYPTGTWRINTSSTDYTVQQFNGTSWITKFNVDSDKLFTGGGQGWATVTTATDYTIADGVYNVIVTSSANITPPALTGSRSIRIHADGGDATFLGTVNGSLNPVFYDGETADMTDTGSEWVV